MWLLELRADYYKMKFAECLPTDHASHDPCNFLSRVKNFLLLFSVDCCTLTQEEMIGYTLSTFQES